MELLNFKRVCKGHGTSYTSKELVVAAFDTATGYATRDGWFHQVRAHCSSEELTKLILSSEYVLKSMPDDVESFKIGYITPERSAWNSLEEAISVPREFVVFVANKSLDEVDKVPERQVQLSENNPYLLPPEPEPGHGPHM